MYIDASQVDSSADFLGSKAWLKMWRVVNAAVTRKCRMRMWYYMYGKDVNSLTVYAMRYSTGDPTANGTRYSTTRI